MRIRWNNHCHNRSYKRTPGSIVRSQDRCHSGNHERTCLDSALTVQEVQQQWARYVMAGCICAIFARPKPCEGWSRSRVAGGLPGVTGGDGGPRMLRTRQSPMGLSSLRLRELHQLDAANVLLLFTIQIFQLMVAMHRVMFIEHPAEPSQPTEAWLPSIWRLKVMRIMAVHPEVQEIEIFQGHFKGNGPKPTKIPCGCRRFGYSCISVQPCLQ